MAKQKLREKNYTHRLEPSIPSLEAKTINQRALINAIKTSSIVGALGAAGTGKTYITAATAAIAFNKGEYDTIVVSRANVPTGRSLGHFPGTVEDKLTPWVTPVLDVLKRFMGTTQFNYAMAHHRIQLQPLETIRGRSFESTFIIVDEAQNLVKDEVISIITRLGEYSKLALLGDVVQSDIKGENGLTWFKQFTTRNKLNIPIIEFGVDDVVRSKIVKEILVALYKENKIET